MSSDYAGVCIDGPMNGKLIAEPHPTKTVRHSPHVPAHGLSMTSARIEAESFYYSHHEVLGDVLGMPELRFWVPSDWPQHERTRRVLRALVESYHASHQGEP